MSDRTDQFRAIIGDNDELMSQIFADDLLRPTVPSDLKLIVEESGYGNELLQFAERCAPDLFIFVFNNIGFTDLDVPLPNSKIRFAKDRPVQPFLRFEKVLKMMSHIKETYHVPIIVFSGHDGEPPMTDQIREIADIYLPMPFGLQDIQPLIQRLFGWPVELKMSEQYKRRISEKRSNAHPVARKNTQRKTILLVEDDAMTLQCLKEAIERDYNALTALDGSSALKIFAQEHVDLVFTDFMMPSLSGVEVLKAVRQQKPHVPMIMMSGNRILSGALACIKAGAYDYIEKPFTPRLMLNTIKHALVYEAGKRAGSSSTSTPEFIEAEQQKWHHFKRFIQNVENEQIAALLEELETGSSLAKLLTTKSDDKFLEEMVESAFSVKSAIERFKRGISGRR